MSAQSTPLRDYSGNMMRLFPRLIAYARGLGCPEEDAPALVRDAALEALNGAPPGPSPDEIEATLRREIGIRCLHARPAEGGSEDGARSEYLEGIRLAHQELQRNFEALDRIDPFLRRIFVLRMSRMSAGNMAKALGLTVRGVKTRIARAMKEVAAMRRDPRPDALLRLARASARMATDGKGPGVPRRPSATRLRVVTGGKKWDGPGMV